MEAIHKFHLPFFGRQKRLMPRGAKIVDVAIQSGQIFLWAQVSESMPIEAREFDILATGDLFEEDKAKHVGTVHDGDGFVWHVVEIVS